MTGGTVLLAAEDVGAGYPGTPAVLEAASVEIRSGRRLALLGGNGSGKTTLLRCLSGAHEPTSGRVLVEGVPVSRRRGRLTAHRRLVQLVLQDPDDQLFAADVFGDVAFGPVNMGLADERVRERVVETLDLLGIGNLADRGIHQLSHGQRKRVALAGAVAMRPRVLLLDEPTAGLDPAGVEAMLATLEALEAVGTTVAMSTHDVDLAWSWADEVAVVARGRVHQGDMASVLTDSALLDRSGLVEPRWVQLLAAVGRPVDRRDPPRTVDEVARLLRRDGLVEGQPAGST